MKTTVDTTGGVRPSEADLIKVGNDNTAISFFFFFIWLCWVLVASGGIFISACGIFSCIMKDLVS